jgi:hypothetical protein
MSSVLRSTFIALLKLEEVDLRENASVEDILTRVTGILDPAGWSKKYFIKTALIENLNSRNFVVELLPFST